MGLFKPYMLLLMLSVIICSVTGQLRKREQFKVMYEWNTFDFTWPSNETRNEAISSGKYVPENVVISGIRMYGDRMYLTLPRIKNGVPATLTYVPATATGNETSPLLKPFPSWAMNAVGDCRAFQSIQSIEIDRNGVMWIIDNGRTSTLNPSNSTAQPCPPSLILINLNNTQGSVVRYTFPPSVANDRSYLNDLVVDDTDSGYAFITDNSRTDPGIIVFNKQNSQSWKIREANSMTASPQANKFFVNGTEVDLNINIDGIAMGPRYRKPDGAFERNVYFSPLASYKLYTIPASSLRNQAVATQPAQMLFQLVGDLGMKPSQTDGMIMDNEGFLFYGLIGNYSIAQWDSRFSFADGHQIIAKDKNYIQWADSFSFDMDGNLYVVINRLHNFVSGKVNVHEVNYRILRSHVGSLSYVYDATEEEIKKWEVPPPQQDQSGSPNSKVSITVSQHKSTSGAPSYATSFFTMILSVYVTMAFI